MGYILGLDQGGTNTRAAVMDLDGGVLGYHNTRGSYFPRDGIEVSMGIAVAAAEKALGDAGLTRADVDMVVAGITGVDWEGDDAVVENELKKHFGNARVFACNDCEIAFYGGAVKPVGAVICAGTGLNAALFAPDGRKFVMGDYLKASLQGGIAIAKRAFEAVVESDLGLLPETELTRLFLDFSQDGSVFELLRRYMTDDGFSSKIKALVPAIIAAANDGDTVARDILDSLARGVCGCFTAAMNKMGMLDLDCDIVLAGSVFSGRENVLTRMVAGGVSRSAKNANVINARFDPIVGACVLGLLKKSIQPDDRVTQNIALSADKLGLLRSAPEL
ncbi:MAG: hypothetical protein FWE86_03280 [Oscillospiraceae bacterium]|nr:hypothetical protein [Oscillospiraceae bacterium]